MKREDLYVRHIDRQKVMMSGEVLALRNWERRGLTVLGHAECTHFSFEKTDGMGRENIMYFVVVEVVIYNGKHKSPTSCFNARVFFTHMCV